jgi:spore coat protein CotF
MSLLTNNIQGRGLTDREMLQLSLELEKGRCKSLVSTLLETSHSELRQVYEECFQTSNDLHSHIYDVMASKGWYETASANPEEVRNAQGYIQNNLHPDDHF